MNETYSLNSKEDINRVYELYLSLGSLRKVSKVTNIERAKIARAFKDNSLKYLNREESTLEHFKRTPKKVKPKKDRVSTCLAKYGVKNVRQNADINKRIIQKRTSAYLKKLQERLDKAECEMLEPFTRVQTLDGKYVFYKMRHKCGHEFSTDLRRDIKCPKCYYVNRFSNFEIVYKEFLKGIGVRIICNKKILPEYELDIYCPDFKMGFEFNGAYWHSIEKKGRSYHADKTKSFLKEGIKIYHFWDYQNEDIIKSVIKTRLNLSPVKYFARKLSCRKLTQVEAKEFFEKNHLDGYAQSTIKIGLFDSNEILVSAMTARHQKHAWELCRFANKLECTVCGGFSKLLKALIKEIKSIDPNASVLISYCNRDISPDFKDTVYYKNSFSFEGDTGSILKYYIKKTESVENRQFFQKHKLSKILKKYNENLTADENLIQNNIFPIRNSGNWKFSYNLGENK